MKKLKKLLLVFAFTVCGSYFVQAARYLQIGFVNNEVIPGISQSGDFLSLSFSDPNLTHLFESYSVTHFELEYPAASIFTNSILNRVYKIRLTDDANDLNNLFNAIKELGSSHIDNVFFDI